MTPSGKLPAAAPEIKGADDPLVCEMITQAVLASAYRDMARECPSSEAFLRAAAESSALVTRLAGQVAARALG